jgi:hypothetical protein
VPGLVYRSLKRIQVVPGPVLVKNLDELPFPRRSKYLDRIGLASILSSRGCAANCTFCSIQEFHRISSTGTIRCRTAENVAQEIQQIHRRTGINRFLFIDDNFFMSEKFMPGRLSDLAREYIERGLKDIRFEVSARSSDLKLPPLEALIPAGLDRVYLGLESGSKTQLKRYRKGCSVNKNIWAIQKIRNRKIAIDFGYIPFDPYLEPNELIDNLDFLFEQNLITPGTLNTLTVTISLFPGTSLYERAMKDGLLHRTSDYYYWFEFKNKEMTHIYEDIIDYFKTRYVINVVDAYSNGFRQQGYQGPSPEEIDPVLRQLLRLWIKRVKALLFRQCKENLDGSIEKLENFIANVLNAHILLNRYQKQEDKLCPAQLHGLEIIRENARQLYCLMKKGPPPLCWSELLAVERRYREHRAALLNSDPLFNDVIYLPPRRVIHIPFPRVRNKTILIDIFVPPDIDVKPPRKLRPPDMPPSTLYSGSVTGMPPILCHLLDQKKNIYRVCRLFKGWNEIHITGEKQVEQIGLLSHVYLFRPIEILAYSALT